MTDNLTDYIDRNGLKISDIRIDGIPVSNNPTMEDQIRQQCNELAEFLIEKNRAYGDSAANPIGIFAKRFDTLAQIDVRIDDKLNRLMKGSEYPGDDTIKDLTGYLILRRIVAKQANPAE